MHRPFWSTLLLLAASVAVRGGYLVAGPNATDPAAPRESPFRDIDSYGYLAGQLVEDGAYARAGGPTAFRPPLYPVVLACAARLQSALGGDPLDPLGMALVHLVLGLGTVYLTLLLGRGLGLGGFAYVAAGLVAVDPLLVYQSGLVMTETLFTLLVVALLVALAGVLRRPDGADGSDGRCVGMTRAAIAGVLFGLAALCRPTIWAFLPPALMALAAAVYVRHQGTGGRDTGTRRQGDKERHGDKETRRQGEGVQRESFSLSSPPLVPLSPPLPLSPSRPPWFAAALSAGCVALAAAVTVAPWAVRNWRVLGRPVLTTTHGGETFWRANNRWFYDACMRRGAPTWQDTAAWHRRRDEVTAGLDEIEADRACYREAWATICARPADFARALLYRWRALWRPWPSAAVYGRIAAIAIGVFYSLQFLLAAVGLCRRTTWRWPWLLLPLLLASVTAVHALYWTDLRMRAPLMPAIALLAAAGCRALVQRIPRLLDSLTP